jgi:hypothetical protein
MAQLIQARFLNDAGLFDINLVNLDSFRIRLGYFDLAVVSGSAY